MYPSLHLYCAMSPDTVVTIPLMGFWGAPQLTVEYQISIGMLSEILQNTHWIVALSSEVSSSLLSVAYS